MSKYPAYRASRQSFGLNVLGTLVVEIEADNGVVGFAVATGGEPAAWIVERHLSRFLVGANVTTWNVSGIRCICLLCSTAVKDSCSMQSVASTSPCGIFSETRQEPVYHLLGGAVRDELIFYATGARPDLAQEMGFIGGKMPLHHAPSEAEDGLRKNLALLAEMRSRTGDDFWLMYDAWMSLDVNYAIRLAHAAAEYNLKWLEEALPPDDYWGYAELRAKMPPGMLVSTGEHEATRWGFRMLLEMGCADIIQPDVNWCGGITELIKISALADARGVLVVPHGSSVYSYHFTITRHNSPFSEFLMMAPQADKVIPMFSPQLLDEPIPVNGRMKLSDAPGFGVRLNPACKVLPVSQI
jgi:L-rhamnonate dehydratase